MSAPASPGTAEVPQSESRLRALFDRFPDAIVAYRGREVVYANSAFAAILGADSPEALVGRDILTIVPPEDRGQAEERLRRMQASREGLALHQTRIVAADGAAVLEVAASPIPPDEESTVLVVARDVTQRLRAEAHVRQQDRMAAMAALAAGVAHEINNPLAYALANLGFALDELQRLAGQLASQTDEVRDEVVARMAEARGWLPSIAEALQEARQGGERVRHVVRDLKTFSRNDDTLRGPVDVRRVLESSINMAYSEIRHRARLVKDYGEAPLVEGSEARLGQVFLNLLINAAQAIREGDVDHQSIRVVTRTEAQGGCVVEISDTGHGIAPELLGRVFDPFFTTKHGVGTGLGLSICQNIVTAMGGEIAVTSTPGRGATFRVTLPRAQRPAPPAESARAPQAQSSAPSPRTRGRVLVIDDEPMMVRAVQRLLEPEHDVVVTTDPTSAVDAVCSGAGFDAILCDLMMPAMSGMDVYEAILRQRPEQARRIVFMTGGAATARAAQFLENIENARVDKPIDRAALRVAIRAHLA